jgi:curved DNA-binding protein
MLHLPVALPSWRVSLGGKEGVYLVDKPATPDYYEALQISPAAQSLIVTKAYRLLAAFYHPDNKETGDPEAFRKVVEAYRVLSDPVRRAAYDHKKFGVFSSSSNGGKPGEPAERRTEDERELRRQLLQALYNVRRTQPHRPSLPLRVIPDLFGCSIDEAQFTLWYLRGKKFIEITDDGMVITVAGVDHVESNEFSLERPASVDPALNPVSFILGTGGRVEGEESSL